MKAHTARGSATKRRIIEAAADLFHRQGVRGTSPDQVIQASATGKGQFYHYFKSKEGLVHEVLRHHLGAIKAGAAPVNYEINSWQDLEDWFQAHLELQRRFKMTRGCPFGTVANELTEDDGMIRQDLGLLFEVVKHKLATFFVREKAHGRLAKSAHEEHLAAFCIATVQGAMLMGKVERDGRPVAIAFHEALTHLKRYALRGAGSNPHP
jgi:AcrR family transcriptional regulator